MVVSEVTTDSGWTYRSRSNLRQYFGQPVDSRDMRRLLGLLASVLLVFSVVGGMLLMHPLEAVAPSASHGVHGEPAGSLVAVGVCVFVTALAVSALVSLPFSGSVVGAVRPFRLGQVSHKLPGLRGSPGGFSYELCVIRV